MKKIKEGKKNELAKLDELKMPEQPIQVLEDPTEELNLLTCSCGGVHFRHAGYLEVQLPYAKIEKGKPSLKVATDSQPVKVCVNCKKAYIVNDSKIWDVTKHIDLTAWEKTEKEAYKATGPGGEC